jgi:hypothetical protein
LKIGYMSHEDEYDHDPVKPIKPVDLEARAYRLAKKVGLIMTRTRRPLSPYNLGGFCLIDPEDNCPVYGHQYDCTAGEILEWIRSHYSI